jgi:hypothetical protein
MTAHLCVIPGCWDFGQHHDDCTDTRCRGCLPRLCSRGLVCNSDRTRLGAELADLGTLYAELVAQPDLVDRMPWMTRQRRPIPTTNPDRKPPWAWVEESGGEELARVLPMGITRVSHQARVSGTREQPAPVNLDHLDLAAASRPASRTLFARGALGLDPDQIGTLSAATILDTIVRTWRDSLWPDQRLPVPTVPVMVDWLSKRLPDACDRYLAIDEYAEEIRDLRSAMRGVLGLNDSPPERCHGVQCRSCDMMNTLYRDGTLVQCRYCGLNYSERDYREWVALLAAQARRMAA